MGLKSLTLLQMCLHISLHPPEDPPSPRAAVVRVILSSGRIRLFRRSFPAGELMSSHPLHLVCRSDSLFIGQRVPPLAPSDLLIPGHSYLLFPSAFFSSALSFLSLASARSNLLLLRPFQIHKTPAGKLQLTLSDEFVERLGEEEEGDQDQEEDREKKSVGMVCTTEEMERDYRELVVRPRVFWKPKLETIRELERKGFAGVRSRKDNNKKKKKKKNKTGDPVG